MATGQRSNEFSTYVFLHLNTTCLPDDNQPCRVTEICMLAVNQNSLKNSSQHMPRVLHKLVRCLNPGNEIQEKGVEISHLTNKKLVDCPRFSEIITSLKSFLHNLTKPVCLLAHNGDSFDFAVLKAELTNADEPSLFRDVYCADSLDALREIDSMEMVTKDKERIASSIKRKPSYDDTTSKPPLKKIKTAPTNQTKEQTTIMKRSQSVPISSPPYTSYKLREYYEELFGSKPRQSHTVEGFCRALIKVALAKPGFFEWVNKHAKKFKEIKPALIN